MSNGTATPSLAEDGATIAAYLRTIDPVVGIVARWNTGYRLETDYTSALRDIGYWLVATWCGGAGHPEWCDEILDEEGFPLHDDATEPMADWFDAKLGSLTP